LLELHEVKSTIPENLYHVCVVLETLKRFWRCVLSFFGWRGRQDRRTSGERTISVYVASGAAQLGSQGLIRHLLRSYLCSAALVVVTIAGTAAASTQIAFVEDIDVASLRLI
jgi:hypothetical protein